MKKIILATISPRRHLLLKNAGLIFESIPPDYNENMLNKYFSYEKIESIAENKALSVLNKIKEPSVIISADTVVVYNNIVLGKPKDFEDALRMLSLLNGNTHKVVTSVCVFDNEKNKKIIKSETSEVTFNILSKEEIKNYIFTYKPYDKAGSYGIQELDKKFIKEIKGDYDNIVGLPVKTLIKMLKEIKNM